MKVSDLSVDHDLASISSIQERLKNEKIMTIEDRHRRKDGSVFPTEVRLCYTDTSGGMTIALARDITARKLEETLLQNALQEAQTAKEQVDNILRSAADGIIVTDPRNRVTHINQIAGEMLGIEAENVVGKPFTKLFTNRELREQARAFLQQNVDLAHQRDFRLNLSGSQFPRIVQALSSNLVNVAGERTGVVTLLRDVSRERELDQIKNEFISTAAHEMRTPMSVIMGYIELLSDSEQFGHFPEEQRLEFLREASRKGEALAQIIDDLFDVSRIEAGLPLPIEKTACDINKILNSVVEHFQKHTAKHTFECDFAAEGEIPADRNKMTQVFENLVSNAVKYSPEGGTIRLSSSIEGNELRVGIADDGLGMSEEQVERVFDKFYRADSSNTAVSGLGLGLSIVKAIIEGHGGHIAIKSVKNQGTIVSLAIPAR